MAQDQREKWLAKEKGTQSWTTNTVILHVRGCPLARLLPDPNLQVSGPAQPNISIIDLPGKRCPACGRETSVQADRQV